MEVAELDRGGRIGGCGCGGASAHAPHESFESSDEFAHREGLGHVVVGSHTEPHEHVGLFIAGREHEYPELAETTDSPTHFEPIEAGEHDVKDDGIGLEVFDRRDARGAIVSDGDSPTFSAQAVANRACDRALILDNDDPGVVLRGARGGD